MVQSFPGNGRKQYGTSSSRQRHDHAPCQSSNTAIVTFALVAEPGAGINPKTVAKWRKRATAEDMKIGPTEPRLTVRSEAEEAIVVAFRRHTLLQLDDCLYALQPSIPHLTGRRCTAVCSVTVSRACRISKATSRSARSSNATPSASSSSTSPRCRPPRASCICSLALTAQPSSPSLNSLQLLTERRLPSSFSTCSRPCHARCTQF